MGQCISTRKRMDKSGVKPLVNRLGGTKGKRKQQQQPAASVIIPEITEHINQSFSSDDDDVERANAGLFSLAHLPAIALEEDDKLKNDARAPGSVTNSIHIHSLYNERHPSSGLADPLQVPLTTKRKPYHSQSSTSLITVERERERIIGNSSSSFLKHPTSGNLPQKSKESIMFDSSSSEGEDTGGTRSPAALRRLISQTKRGLRRTSTSRLEQLQHLQTRYDNDNSTSIMPTLSLVYQSLVETVISESPSDEDGETAANIDAENINDITSDSIPFDFVTKPHHTISTARQKQPTTTIKKSTGSLRNTRNINHRLERIGPLSPVKIKASNCVSPNSIRIYDNNDIPKINVIGKSLGPGKDTPTAHAKEVAKEGGLVNGSVGDLAAIDQQTMQNFYKLKLQIQVAKKQEAKQRLVMKMDDRIHDVNHHRQLWDVYQAIQSDVANNTSTENHEQHLQRENGDERTSDSEMPDQSDITNRISANPKNLEESSSCTSSSCGIVVPRQRRSRRHPRVSILSKFTRGIAEQEQTTSLKSDVIINGTSTENKERKIAPVAVEYDLEEVHIVSRRENSKSPQKSRRMSRIRNSISPVRTTIDDGNIMDYSTNDELSDTNLETSSRCRQDKAPLERTNSFDLHQTETWFFNFQQEFEKSNSDENKRVTIDQNEPYPVRNSPFEDDKCDNSQAGLSLLSESSMEIQRRLYAEKRRQRKKLSSIKQQVQRQQTLADTPLIRNGTNKNNRNNMSGNSSCRSEISCDYGPSLTGGGRPPLSTDARSTQSSTFGGGSAQDIFNAPNEKEKLRIAKEILRNRNVANLEVIVPATITTPKPRSTFAKLAESSFDGNDNSSVVSDLDESCASNRSYQSSHILNDYGPQRRPGRRNRYHNRTEGEEDQSSIVSDVSFELSNKADQQTDGTIASVRLVQNDSANFEYEVLHKNVATEVATKPPYDFQSVVQRRLDIEKRLRALMSSDDSEPYQSFPRRNISTDNNQGNELLVPEAINEVDSRISKEAPLLNRQRSVDVTPVAKLLDTATDLVVAKEITAVTPDSNALPENENDLDTQITHWKPSMNKIAATKGRTDFRRLLDAVVVVNEASPASNSATNVTDYNEQPHQLLFPAPTSVATSLSVINESYESNESPDSRIQLPSNYLNKNDSNVLDTHLLDEATNETLLLANQVEERVNKLLKQYHDDVPLLNGPTTYVKDCLRDSTETLHVITDSP